MEEKDESSDHVENLTNDLDVLHTLRGVAALKVTERIEPVSRLSKGMMQLCVICGFVFLGASISGYDASLMATCWKCLSFKVNLGLKYLG